jgi:S1-C subfamily serine protease
VRLALLIALLLPAVALTPPRSPEVVGVAVGADRASGFVAGHERVVTVAHVLTGGEPVSVAGRPATVVRADRRLDLAVLHVDGLDGPEPRPADAAGAVRVGDEPARVVRRIGARVDGAASRPALELRGDISPGDSGAPVVTPSGGVAGIVFARSRTRDDTAYAVDARALSGLLR